MKKLQILLLFLLGLTACVKLVEKPNILIIYTDEHNFRTLGCYRDLLPDEQAFVWGEGVEVETPNINGLARAGQGWTPLHQLLCCLSGMHSLSCRFYDRFISPQNRCTTE